MSNKQKSFVVYKHTCVITNKSYIGITNNIERRNKEHKRKSNGCTVFARAISKYGWSSFTHEVLKENLTLDEANYWEERLIYEIGTIHPSGYNLKTGGNHAIHNEETRKKIGEAHKGEKCHWFGNYGSESHISKMYLVIFPDGRIEIANGMAEFCRDNGLNTSCMNAVATKREKHHRKHYCELYTHGKYSEEELKKIGNDWAKLMSTHVHHKKGKDSIFSKQYLVITPDGYTLNINSLNIFCKNNGLSSGSMSLIANNKAAHHKGYYCEYFVIGKYTEEDLKNKGNNWSEWWKNHVSYKKGSENKNSKRYLIINPNGEQFVINGLSEFSRNNYLSVKSMNQVSRGYKQHHKSFFCEKFSPGKYSDIEIKQKGIEWVKLMSNNVPFEKGDDGIYSKSYLITSPDEDKFIIKNMAQFCRDNNLSHGHMSSVATGKRIHHKGYKVEYYKQYPQQEQQEVA